MTGVIPFGYIFLKSLRETPVFFLNRVAKYSDAYAYIVDSGATKTDSGRLMLVEGSPSR